jgi:UDP-glucose 4-epimerase
MVVPRFIRSALNDEPIGIYGTGKQTRCFCYVGDVVEAVVRLVNCEDAAGRVYNIGSNEEVSIEELADRVIEMTDSKSPKQYVSYEDAYGRPIEDMMRRVPNVNRIKDAVGWESRTSLDEILRAIMETLK